MSESRTCEVPVPKPCTDCKEPIGEKALEHGREGFGHEGRCCDCYDKRQRGPS